MYDIITKEKILNEFKTNPSTTCLSMKYTISRDTIRKWTKDAGLNRTKILSELEGTINDSELMKLVNIPSSNRNDYKKVSLIDNIDSTNINTDNLFLY